MNDKDANQNEVEQHAAAAFGRIASNPRFRRRRQSPRSRKAGPVKPDWFSGVEAALPKGDRD